MGARSAAFVLLLAMPLAGTGCGLFHSAETPQQQFMEAVQRGNAAQASQLWLSMSPDNRANFDHGIGFKPTASTADVQAQLAAHQKQADAAASGGGEFIGGGAQTVEIPLPADLHSSTLQNLPNLATTTATTASTIGPDAETTVPTIGLDSDSP